MSRNCIDLNTYSTFELVKTIDNQLIIVNKHDEYIGKNVLTLGRWEPHIRNVLSSIIKEGDTVIDIGANIGTHTLYMSKLVGNSGKVHAFEPESNNYNSLFFSLMINKCFNTKVYHCGIGDCYKSMYINDIWKRTNISNNFGAISLQQEQTSKEDEEISVYPLDSFLFQSVRLIKIDAEGMEESIIKGMMTLLCECRPYIIIEIHLDNVRNMLHIMNSMEYKLFQLEKTIDFVAFPSEKEQELYDLFTKQP